ncbi:prolyl oligopeptidase family serine peptidase [Erythrobacter sp. LQ02-29]|uniref:S9 family peptidase n=1 Tax=Erythrobacter sp. LQ02-29 TaxID=2920384 RepID=UPI001F4EE43F|nr:prolyl oligopeptidase family serine peptidase [Erythrobacter sp. LQ02-29]MCP9223655.1 prolyl oligopeptidase family serine peptidase [Erythrobacter sp. LQ02-29]
MSITTTMATRRTVLMGTTAIGLSAVASGARTALAQASATGGQCWPDITAPAPPRIEHRIEQLGRVRDDPYSWMKFVPRTGTRTLEKVPPIVRDNLKPEMAYADAVLAPLADRRQSFFAAMMARRAQGSPPPLPHGDWRYESEVPEGEERPVHYRITPAGKREVLVDENARARGYAYYRATAFQPSPDNRYYAWAEDIVGNDRHRIAILDTRTGRTRIVVPDDAYGYGGLVFGAQSRNLFWIKRDARNRPTQLLRVPAAGGTSELVYEEHDPAIFMQVSRTADDRFVVLDLSGPDTSEVRLIAAGAETEPPRIVAPRREGLRYTVHGWDGGLVALTNADGATDNKLVALDLETLEPDRTLVPHVPGRLIETLLPFAGGLVMMGRADGLQHVSILHAGGARIAVPFDAPAYALTLAEGQNYDARSVRLVYETPAQPPLFFDVALADGERTLAGETRYAGYDPDDYVVERLEARSPDGAMVPLTVLSRRDTPRDGSAPLLLYGYGAYGVSSDPVFSVPATAWVDAGARYAIAHVRGGSEKGRGWFLDGRRFHKRNSMTDFIACALHLVRGRYTAAGRIAAFGLSAGGLLVAGATNLMPDLWGAVVAKVPFVDMLNTMSDADHPLVPLFRPDWGDPLADPEAYDYIASISPYENVAQAAYPPLLTTAGLKDDRVSYWEPWKLVAEVRRQTTSDAPAVLSLDLEAGHQTSADLGAEYAQMALFWAFAERGISC